MIVYVNNFEEAKKYPVMFGTSEIFFDNNQDKFYCKTVDSVGKYTMSSYEFHQVENEKPLSSADFVPREQFDTLNAKIDNLMALLTAPTPSSQPSSPEPSAQPTTTGRKSKEVNSDGK